MFHDSNIARPLYDTLNGGPPKAFECLLTGKWIIGVSQYFPSEPHCGKITRTERGMRMHLKLVHNFEAQQCLSLTE